MKKLPKWIRVSLCILLALVLVVLPLITVLCYHANFGSRYQSSQWLIFTTGHFPGLQVARSDFETRDGTTLAGYQYSRAGQNAKGVVILAHGLGAGHNSYMPLIDAITAGGYLVFAYDVTGNDNSSGDSIQGLPQGVIDLDYAIRHVSQHPDYQNLPICLIGHSWGGYSVGNVLNLHPEVSAAVLIAGFNKTEDLLLEQGKQMAGNAIYLQMPYLKLYEQLRFGREYTNISAVEGIQNSNAGILVVQSQDDPTVPMHCGYDYFQEAFEGSPRVQFLLYPDKGHNLLLYSEEATQRRAEINAAYTAYVETHGGEHNLQVKVDFIATCPQWTEGYAPNPELVQRVLALFDTYCGT